MAYVPPKYPGEIPTADDLPDRTDDIDWLYAARYNELKKELRAALIELGILPKGSDADVVARLDRIQDEIDALGVADPGEGHINIFGPSYNSIGQGTWAFYMDTLRWLAGVWHNSTHANGDNISYKVYLAAGTYTLLLFHTSASNAGIFDLDINAVEVASFDLYGVGVVHNLRKVQTGIVIATSGLKTLKLRVDGKNASSSDYYSNFNYVALWRTA